MRFTPALLWLLSGAAIAAQQPPAQVLDKLNQPDDNLPSLEANEVKEGVEQVERAQKTIELTEEDLLANPRLLGHALDNAVAAEDANAARMLLPLYRRLPAAQQDGQLIRYAEAMIAKKSGNLAVAIARYREMISENPTLQPVRLQLAMALLSDHQDDAAQGQFEKLQSEELPDGVRRLVEQGLKTIRERRSWTFNASGYYRYESNINGAPKQKEHKVAQGKWTFPEPRKAHGIHLDASAERRIPLQNGFYGQFDTGVSTDWFWDAHDYDDFRFRIGAGVGWQNVRWNLNATPFINRRVYGGKGYATNFGVDLGASYWLNPQWRLSSSAQVMRKRHDKRKWLDGNQYFGGVSALYVNNAQQYFFGGFNFLDSNAKDPSDSYSRFGVSGGWGQEWPLGVSTRLSGGVARRVYDGEDFFGIKRKDKEYSAALSLWMRDFYFFGITPRLTFNWSKTDSNHFYYTNDNFDTYLEFSRTF